MEVAMSGINRPEGRPALLEAQTLEKKYKKIEKPSKSLLEEGIASSKSPKTKVAFKRSTITKTEGINVKVSVEKVRDETAPRKRLVKSEGNLPLLEITNRTVRDKTYSRKRLDKPTENKMSEGYTEKNPQVIARNKVISKLFNYLSSNFIDADELRLILEVGLGNFDKASHTFVVGSHIILVTKVDSDEPIIALTDVAKKSFARGGFGKVYPVTMLDSDENELALKLSRKKLDKGSLQKNAAMPTRSGERAKKSIEEEIKIINYLRRHVKQPIGLNVEMFGKVSLHNDIQVGYFLRRYDSDLIDFCLTYALPSEVCNQCREQTENGMKEMHRLGLVHRDIKPDNILVKKTDHSIEGTEFPSFNFVLTDFGNTASLNGIFSTSHPSFNKIFGGTHCYISKKYAGRVVDCLNRLNKFLPTENEYQEIITEIKKILIESDRFALALSFYIMWMNKTPPFSSFQKKTFFEGSTATENKTKLDRMYQELRSASLHLSYSVYGDANYIAKSIMIPISLGL